MEEEAAQSSAAAGRRSPEPGLIRQMLGGCTSIRKMLEDRRSTLRRILRPKRYADLESLFYGPIDAVLDAMPILMRHEEIPIERAETGRGDLNLLLQQGQAAEANLNRIIRLAEGRDPEDTKMIIRRELGVALDAPRVEDPTSSEEGRSSSPMASHSPQDDLMDYLIQQCSMTMDELVISKDFLLNILYPGWRTSMAWNEVDADLDPIFEGPIEALDYAISELRVARQRGVAAEWLEIGWMCFYLLQRHLAAVETELDAMVSMVGVLGPVSARIVLRAYVRGLNFQV